MSYPPRPPMVPGMGMFMGMPPGMGIPPPMMPPGNHPPGGMQFFGGPMRPGGPPPLMRPPPMSQNHATISKPPMTSLDDKPSDHPQPLPQPTGPPVTVFVGNITEKWPDAMIRQLLATCGQVINWKRIQGASGKLQGFGFCEFNGPDAGLRAVRLLHELEVGDKKLVVKVDAKTSSVLEEFKAERKKIKTEADAAAKNGENNERKTEEGKIPDYMDQEMKESDERSRQRISIIFREFKNEIDAYIPPGSEKAKSEKESSANKQQIQDKLHLLKLSSLENTSTVDIEPDLPEDLAMEEGKREIITREISIFRESMKIEKQREEERKKMGRERREKEREREERKRTREKGTEDINSPDHLSFRDRDRFSPRRDKGGGSNDRNRGDRGGSRDSRRDRRGRDDRDRGDRRDRDRDRDRRRERSRDRIQRKSKSRSVERIPRSPPPPSSMGPKPRYREREEEEEQVDQKRLERKAREKEAAYEERLREWEQREAQKAREYKKLTDRKKRQEDDMEKEAKRMKQFLEDYDDEKHDNKYYRGKDLQRRLAERAKELEDDNKDRQKEREELEEMKLRMMTSSSRLTPNATSTPNILLDRYKKPTIEVISSVSTPSPSTTPLFTGLKMELKPSINSRLQALANNNNQSANNNLVTTNNHVNSVEKEKSEPPPSQTAPEAPKTSFESIQFNTVKSTSNPSTPNSLTSSPVKQSPIPKGFQLTLNPPVNNSSPVKGDDDDSRQSFGSAPSPGMPSPSPQNFNNEGDDSSMQSPLDAPKKKKMDVKDIFNQDEDDDGFGMGRKRKLVPLDFGDEANKKLKKEENKNPEEKKKHIKALIDKIPTDKDALFEYEIDWEMVDTTLMEKRIRPWINKKIVEYIGEPEPTLVDFICSKVLGRSAPRSILEDVIMVLDEEAEVFVVKMWRLLVYEIEAKKYGLAGKAQ